jgi:hypothetical protein
MINRIIVNALIAKLVEFFTDKDFSIPIWEVMLLLIINSICLLLGKHKAGLLVTYLFVFYWGFVFNRTYFVDILGQMTWGLYVYSLLGAAMALVIVVSFFIQDS